MNHSNEISIVALELKQKKNTQISVKSEIYFTLHVLNDEGKLSNFGIYQTKGLTFNPFPAARRIYPTL